MSKTNGYAKADKRKGTLSMKLREKYKEGTSSSINKEYNKPDAEFHGFFESVERDITTSFGLTNKFNFVDENGQNAVLFTKALSFLTIVSENLSKGDKVVVFKDVVNQRWMIDYD